MAKTEQEFKTALLKICSKVPEAHRPKPWISLKDLVYTQMEVWTHCYHCNISNERFSDIRFAEKFRELNHKCHAEGWKCRHCGVGQLEVHSGWQGDPDHLPSYDEVLKKTDKFINEFLLLESII